MKQKNGAAFGRVSFGPFLYMSVHGPFQPRASSTLASAARGLRLPALYRQLTGTQIMTTTGKMWLGLLALITSDIRSATA